MDKHYCYILRNGYEPHKNYTYNGYTNNPERRIRQHNQEITGGAKRTKRHGNKSWEYCVLMTGFKDKKNALQCEWAISKPAGKKRTRKYTRPSGRIKGLNEIIKRTHWTRQSEWNNEDMKYTIWILREYIDELTDVPPNYTINVCDNILDSLRL